MIIGRFHCYGQRSQYGCTIFYGKLSCILIFDPQFRPFELAKEMSGDISYELFLLCRPIDEE